MMGVLNFAHASFYMLGAYFAYQISTWVGFFPALLAAPIIVGLLGSIVERYGLRVVHRHGHIAELLFTFGLALLIAEVVPLIWGRSSVDYRIPEILAGSLLTVGNVAFPVYKGFMMLVSVVMMAGLYILLVHTRLGLVVRAALSRPDMVEALGHNVPTIYMLVFGIGAGLAGLAGVIGGNAFMTNPQMAGQIGMLAFVVIVVGGLGSVTGAFVASMLIGMVQTLSVGVDLSVAEVFRALNLGDLGESAVASITVSQVAPIIPFVLMVLLLAVRPRGLLGTRDV
jgi:branched-chain amino acid transport system permease protein